MEQENSGDLFSPRELGYRPWGVNLLTSSSVDAELKNHSSARAGSLQHQSPYQSEMASFELCQGNSPATAETQEKHAVDYQPFFPLQILLPAQQQNSESLINDLDNIKLNQERISKIHEEKKLQLANEFEQDIQKLKEKYDALFKKEDSEFLQNKIVLDAYYNKVLMNQVLASKLRSNFMQNKGAGQNLTSSEQLLQGVRPQPRQRSLPRSPSLPSRIGPALWPTATPTSLASVRPRSPVAIFPPIPSNPSARQTSPFSSNYAVRSSSTPTKASSMNLDSGNGKRPRIGLDASLFQDALFHTNRSTNNHYYHWKTGSARPSGTQRDMTVAKRNLFNLDDEPSSLPQTSKPSSS